MDIKQFEKIKEQIEVAKTKKIQAETKIEQIEQQWKDEFDIGNIEEADTLKDELTNTINNLDTKQNKLMKEIEELLIENNIEV